MVIVINILSKNLIFAALYKIIYREVCSYDYTCSFCCTLLNYVLVHNIVICTSNSEIQYYYFQGGYDCFEKRSGDTFTT